MQTTLFSWHGHSRLFINFCTCFSTLPPSEAFTSTQINVSCCGSILISPFAYPIPLPLPPFFLLFLLQFYYPTPTENSLADPLPVVDTAKYLGAMISANNSSNADVAYRCSQAATAFRCLFPVFTRPQIHPKRKLQIYAQIVMAILLHGSESKVLRQILKFSKSKVHTIIGFWTPLALIAPITSCCNRLLPKSQVSCSPVS